MADNLAFDDSLFEILKCCKTLPNFLDVVFGFLSRRTDFYCVTADPNLPVGFPEGLSERFVKDAFFKWKFASELKAVDENGVNSETTTKPQESNRNQKSVSRTDPSNKLEKSFFTTSDSYNGAVFENYSWSQSIKEVDVFIKVPEGVTTKNLLVAILPQKISIKLKDVGVTVLEGDLCQKIQNNDAIWSLDRGIIEIHIEKTSEMWWNCLLTSEPKLDITKLDCSRPFEELSDEAQAKIEELTWNQERKRLGLPTSHEQAMHEKLKKAWNLPDSPFKGPFDPNSIIFE